MPNDPLTILRIKRKRTEEPLDALLVQQENEEKRLKKSNENKSVLKVSATALPTVFRLAETVEEASFLDVVEAKKLKDRISRRIQPGSRPQTPTTREEKKDEMMKKQMNVSKTARYRVINQNRNKSIEQTAPPVVQSSEEKAAQDLFQMFEAVRDDDTNNKNNNNNNNSTKHKLFVDEDTEDVDDIMCNFIPMIKEYLTLNDRDETSKAQDGDYVYDVYYRDDQEHNSVNAHNVGSLVWLDGTADYVDDNDSESELGDFGDEDSNAEDYYQNDYPEEEDDIDEHSDHYRYDLSSEDEDYSL